MDNSVKMKLLQLIIKTGNTFFHIPSKRLELYTLHVIPPSCIRFTSLPFNAHNSGASLSFNAENIQDRT